MSGDLLAELNRQGWLTTTQVAELFGCPRSYVSELARSKKIRGKQRPPILATYKAGHLLLIRREIAERYLAAHPRLRQHAPRRAPEEERAAS